MRKFIAKKTIAVILLLILTISFTVETYAFNDIYYGEWYYNNIIYLQKQHIIDGYEDNTFRPNNYVSKAEALKMLLLQSNENIDFLNDYKHWYSPYTNIALEKSYISDKFYNSINTYITRYEVAELIVKIFDLESKTQNINLNRFSDTRNYYVSILNSLNIVTGYYENGKYYFKGKNNLTRAELCTIIINIQKYLNIYQGEKIYKQIDWYIGANDISELIDPNIKITQSPISKEDFLEVLKFMSVNDISTISFIYNKNEQYKKTIEDIKNNINVAVNLYREQFVEYGSYYSKFKKLIRDINNNNFSLTLEISSDIYSNNEISKMRSDSFKKIINIRNEFYNNKILNHNMTKLEKAEIYYNWIIKSFQYDHKLKDTSTNAYSAFQNGEITCMGYTSIFNLFLKLEGIETTGIICKIKDNGSKHIWTYAYIDGKWRCFDVTAGEISNDLTFFDINEEILQEFYEY